MNYIFLTLGIHNWFKCKGMVFYGPLSTVNYVFHRILQSFTQNWHLIGGEIVYVITVIIMWSRIAQSVTIMCVRLEI